MNSIIVATGNRGKLREIREILSGLPVELVALKEVFTPVPMIPETGSTFFENAAIKARWVYERKKTWSLADDSGLDVDFLGGAPGVQSARYAGDGATDRRRCEKLLAAMAACPLEKRTCRFRCVIVMKISETEEVVSEGVCEGRLGWEPLGTDGFGYDPLFFPLGYDRTFAQLLPSEKNRISHRAKALFGLRRTLDERFGITGTNGSAENSRR
jgi:XTP/dITP diphosphohydrolase